jgi:hypothetical protein
VDGVELAASAKALSQRAQIANLRVRKQSTPYKPDSTHDFLHRASGDHDNGVPARGEYNIGPGCVDDHDNHSQCDHDHIALWGDSRGHDNDDGAAHVGDRRRLRRRRVQRPPPVHHQPGDPPLTEVPRSSTPAAKSSTSVR